MRLVGVTDGLTSSEKLYDSSNNPTNQREDREKQHKSPHTEDYVCKLHRPGVCYFLSNFNCKGQKNYKCEHVNPGDGQYAVTLCQIGEKWVYHKYHCHSNCTDYDEVQLLVTEICLVSIIE